MHATIGNVAVSNATDGYPQWVHIDNTRNAATKFHVGLYVHEARALAALLIAAAEECDAERKRGAKQ